MEEDFWNPWGSLQRVKFLRNRLSIPTGSPTDTSAETEIPFGIVPDFSARYPWHIPTTAAFEFLRHLRLISASTLAEDKRVCVICYEPYVSGEHAEKPTRLPCQHVFGRRCIGKWILPEHAPPKSTCPMCRSELFSDEAFEVPLTSPPEADVADWVRETSILCEGDPNAEERMELLVQEIQRIYSAPVGTPCARTTPSLREVAPAYEELVHQFERIMAEIHREFLARNSGAPLSHLDRIAFDALGQSMLDIVFNSQPTRAMSQELFSEILRRYRQAARGFDADVVGDGNS